MATIDGIHDSSHYAFCSFQPDGPMEALCLPDTTQDPAHSFITLHPRRIKETQDERKETSIPTEIHINILSLYIKGVIINYG